FTPLDDFEHGTRAAIAGGVTTVCSMVYQEGTLRAGIARGLRDAERSLADFAFHVVVTDPSEAAIAELPRLALRGCSRPFTPRITRSSCAPRRCCTPPVMTRSGTSLKAVRSPPKRSRSAR